MCSRPDGVSILMPCMVEVQGSEAAAAHVDGRERRQSHHLPHAFMHPCWRLGQPQMVAFQPGAILREGSLDAGANSASHTAVPKGVHAADAALSA